jgi:SAM-dependent methyltransferase
MCLRFVARDFTQGFADWPGEQFDGVVAGLSLPYAESFSEEKNCWSDEAYDRVLAESYRLLKPGGAFVFSTHVPSPAWSKLAWHAVAATIRSRRPVRNLKDAYRMWSCGNLLSQEASRGRVHYLPLEAIVAKLQAAGFGGIENCLSYAGQAYILRCAK